MTTRRTLVAVCFIGLTPALIAPAAGQSTTYSGAADFKVYCASCHGERARGDGPIASALRRRPADLTQLARRSEGMFPTDKVFKIIDGRTTVASHGNSDMPIWGDVFARAQESPTPDAVKLRIDTLVKYLDSIQQKP